MSPVEESVILSAKDKELCFRSDDRSLEFVAVKRLHTASIFSYVGYDDLDGEMFVDGGSVSPIVLEKYRLSDTGRLLLSELEADQRKKSRRHAAKKKQRFRDAEEAKKQMKHNYISAIIGGIVPLVLQLGEQFVAIIKQIFVK